MHLSVAATQKSKDDAVRCLAILQYLTLSAPIRKKCSCECCHAEPEKLSEKYINAQGKASPKVFALINSFSLHHPSHYLCLYHRYVSICCGMIWFAFVLALGVSLSNLFTQLCTYFSYDKLTCYAIYLNICQVSTAGFISDFCMTFCTYFCQESSVLCKAMHNNLRKCSFQLCSM